MSTQEKILQTALKLFNEKGTDEITTRHIAAEMKISHGNLCYHFPKKEEIIKKLYERLVGELNETLGKLQNEELPLHTIFAQTRESFSIQLKYKFFLIEIVKIMRWIPEIKTHFQNLYQHRQRQFKNMITNLIHNGYFKKEYSESFYEKTIQQFYIIGDFWISEAEILYVDTEENKLDFYFDLAINFFTPFLTEKGLQEISSL